MAVNESPKIFLHAALFAVLLALVPQAAVAEVPQGYTEHTIGSDLNQTYYVTAGEGPAIVLLHGFPQDWSTWLPVSERLSHRYRVIMPDLRGIGRSLSASDDFGPEAMADDILAVLDAEGIRAAYVAGHDIGGPVAYVLARRNSERVTGVMLLESPLEGMASFERPRDSLMMWHLAFHQIRDLPEGLLADRERLYVGYFLSEFNSAEDAAIDRYAEAYTSRDGNLRALLAVYRQLDKQRKFNLSHTSVFPLPITIVGGEKVFGQIVEAMATDLEGWGCQNVKTQVIEAGGHYLMDEMPGRIAAIITKSATKAKTSSDR
jgi:pimeloyl-ACP methyl ester carboxylesterase